MRLSFCSVARSRVPLGGDGKRSRGGGPAKRGRNGLARLQALCIVYVPSSTSSCVPEIDSSTRGPYDRSWMSRAQGSGLEVDSRLRLRLGLLGNNAVGPRHAPGPLRQKLPFLR